MSGTDPAIARWLTIQALRIGGIALFVYAVLAGTGRAPWLDGVPREWAWALALVGAGDALVVPLLLARRWSSAKS